MNKRRLGEEGSIRREPHDVKLEKLLTQSKKKEANNKDETRNR